MGESNFELAKLVGKVGRKDDTPAAHRAVLAEGFPSLSVDCKFSEELKAAGNKPAS